jgi:hypothetical protein
LLLLSLLLRVLILRGFARRHRRLLSGLTRHAALLLWARNR